MNDEQRRVALFQGQPEGLGLILRPAALSFAHVAGLHLAHSALLDAKSAPAEPMGLVLTGPSIAFPDEAFGLNATDNVLRKPVSSR